MSSAKESWFSAGKLRCVILDFDAVGDLMPMHRHGEEDGSHISAVQKGQLLVRSVGEVDRIVEAGAIVDWPLGAEHEWECLSAPAQVLNVFKK